MEHRQAIMHSIKNSTAVVISGKTGCGKSTQVPQFIYQDNKESVIAICEPRRLAAMSLAERVSQELNSKVGNIVAYQVGMDSTRSSSTKICYMTYGIIIQQLLHNQKIPYTHIILDEVHERSLDMDFTFVTLKKLLEHPSRRHIKIIIMSATLSSDDFSKYFATNLVDAGCLFSFPKFNYKEEKYKILVSNGKGRELKEEVKLAVEIEYPTREEYEPC